MRVRGGGTTHLLGESDPLIQPVRVVLGTQNMCQVFSTPSSVAQIKSATEGLNRSYGVRLPMYRVNFSSGPRTAASRTRMTYIHNTTWTGDIYTSYSYLQELGTCGVPWE